MKKASLFIAVMVLGCVVVLEGALMGLSCVLPRLEYALAPIWAKPVVHDERLGYRPHPGHPEHDRYGFRNNSVPEDADIVALGDSQTYGTNALRHEAWPQQLEMLSGVTVYNMSAGAYGPTHSLVLLEEALERKPRLLIVAVYAGNDLYDGYRLVYDQGQLEHLRTDDVIVLQRIREAEDGGALASTIVSIYRRGETYVSDKVDAFGIRRFVSDHSKVYGLTRALKDRLVAGRSGGETETAWADEVAYAQSRGAYCEVFEQGKLRTVFTPRYRLTALDRDDPRIAEGHRVAMSAMAEISDRVRERGIAMAALLIPTKELVFSELVVATNDGVSDEYAKVVQCEQEMWSDTKAFLRERGIDHIDALPALRASLKPGGRQPYSESLDGHPNAAGYAAIATATHQAVERLGLLEKAVDGPTDVLAKVSSH